MIKKIIFTTNFIVAFSVLCCGQTWDWTNFVSQGGNDYVHDVDTDSLGNVYIALRARNEVFFSDNTFREDSCAIFLPYIGDSDMSVAKYDKNGKLLWAKRDGSFDPSVGYALALDSENNIYSSGTFYNEFYFGQDSIRNTSPDSSFVQHPFLCKYSADGERLWARSGKILNGRDRVNSIGYEVSVDSKDQIIYTGLIQGLAVFENDTIGVSGKQTAFVVSYDKDGNLNWAKDKGNWSRALDLAINSKDEIYVGGDYGAGRKSLMIEKRSENGDLLWRIEDNNGNDGEDYIHSVEVDKNDDVYFCGTYFGDLLIDTIGFVAKSENQGFFLGKISNTGEVAFIKDLGNSNTLIEQLHMDMVIYDEHILIGGSFNGTLFFEKDSITSWGEGDGFIASFDLSGNFEWVKHLRGKPERFGGIKYSDGIRGLELDMDNNLFVCGYLKDSIVFDSTIFPGWGGTSGFVGKMFLPIDADFSIDKQKICEGDSINLVAIGNGSPITYEWSFESGQPSTFNGANTEVTFLSPGQFDLQLIVSNPYVSDTIIIEDFLVNSNPNVDLGMDTIICEDNVLLLDAGSDFTSYSWSTGDSTSIIEVNTTGNYVVEVVDSNSCIGQDEILVTVDPCVSTDNVFNIGINAFPNPSDGQFEMNIPFKNSSIIFYNTNGMLLSKKELSHGRNKFEFSNLNSSFIYYKIFEKNIQVYAGKLAIIQ